jgi:hypothetical protein
VASQDKVVRRLAATIAVNTRIAQPDRPVRSSGTVPLHLAEHYEREVDPERSLSQHERRKRASAAWRRDEALRLLAEYRNGGSGSGGAA